MRLAGSFAVVVIFAGNIFGQSPEPPLSNTQLSVHTLVREDIFAGWRLDDMKRFERGERNVDLLLKQRPKAKADLLAWKGATALYRAVIAHEAKKSAQFESHYKKAVDHFAEAQKLAPKSIAVAAVTGGAYVMFADRLPEKNRAAAWKTSYESYRVLWAQQGPFVDRLPVHMRGELLSGLAQSAQRLGRDEEVNQYLDKILEVARDTPYERVAKRWKDDPKTASTSSISCKTCHAPGRLAARLKNAKGE